MKATPTPGIFLKLALSATLLIRYSSAFAADAPPYATDISLSDIMASIVMPAADALWKAVSVDVSAEGQVVTAPQTDEDWGNLRNSAVTLAAATNLLLVPQLAVVNPDKAAGEAPLGELAPAAIAKLRSTNMQAWTAHVLLLHETALQALKTIDAHDADALSNVGGDLDAACESCHLQFWYPEG